MLGTVLVNWLVTAFPTQFQQLPTGQLVMVLPNGELWKLPHHYQTGLLLALLDPNPLGKILGMVLIFDDRADFLAQKIYT